jgi:hypothetical protein
MSATEILREDVRELIDHAGDKTLRMVKVILEKEQGGDFEEDWWDELPDELQELIEMSLKESEEGRGIPHEEMAEKYSRWFKK